MKRVFKFRGKSLYDNEWVYGNLQIVGDYDSQAYINPYNDYDKFIEVDKNTVGQATGLFDINGNEFYEDHIVKTAFSDKPFGVITWHSNGYFFIDCNFGQYPLSSNGYRPLGEMLSEKIDGKKIDIEIIGNIHDNSELLKEYLWEQWKFCNHPKYYQYFDEWYSNITDIQKMYFKCWSEGKKTPYC